MRRTILVLTVAAIIAAMVAVTAVPAAAQTTGEIAQAQQKGKAKAKQKAAMPQTGGISPGSVALLGLGASALLIGGGLVVRRRARS